MKIKILLPMNKLPKHHIEATKEYAKRLTRYCKLTLIKSKSFEDLIKKLPTNAVIIGITHDADTITSEELANKLSTLAITGKSNLCFLVLPNNTKKEPSIKGSSSYDILMNFVLENKINYQELALSKMSLGLDLSCVILHEQIYRAYRIINNQAYHK